ncbi:hypothetical protein ACWEKT_18445 [Nocardia takedensis]
MGTGIGPKALKQRRIDMKAAAEALGTSAVGGDVATMCLLLFYAAECGLKERLIRRGNHRDTSGIKDDLHHDLRKLAKKLRIGPSVDLAALERCFRHDGSGRIDVPKLHEAWRYGDRICEVDQIGAGEALRSLITWCEKDMG